MLRRLVLISLLGCAAPAWAQITVEPEALSVSVPQYGEATRTLTLTNAGSEAVSFCLSFGRPLEGSGAELYLSEESLGSACGPYGEVFTQVSRQDLGISWDPYGITMTPDGRIFAADYAGDRTHELTPELELIRSFEHPFVAGCYPHPVTTGVTYNTDTGTLWWLNIDSRGFEVCSALLLEGDLDGVPTGRQVELPIAETAPEPYEGGSPVGASYDAQTDRYFFIDFANDDVWAVDTLGNVIDGYPVTLAAYPEVALGFGLDIQPSEIPGAAEGLRFEVATNIPGLPGLRRIVTVGGLGGDTAPAPAEPLETPTITPVLGGEVMGGAPVRSRLDPNGVLYYPVAEFLNDRIVAVRPHPLPPSWLVVEEWDGELGPGDSVEVPLTFRPGARPVGTYEAALQVFDAATDAVVEVPLSLTVTEGTDAEEEGAEPEAVALSVYPNPSAGSATVALTLAEPSEVRVAVYDVLGREVAVLHEGRFSAGSHRLVFDGAELPSGLYLVGVESNGFSATRRVTLMR